MAVYREEIVDSKWGSKRQLRNSADLRRAKAKAMRLARLGKFHCKYCAATFPNNDRNVLGDVIAPKRKMMKMIYGRGAAASAAVMAVQKPVEVSKYVGRVKSLQGDKVIAQIGPPDEMDRWDVIIPRANFKQQPEVNQRIACTIARWDTHADVTVQILSKKPLPELKDFGINKEELLSWASQLDV